MARHFVENHFADTTLLVDATFRRVRHFVEKKNSQVQRSVEIVSHFFFTKRRNQRSVAWTKCHGLLKNNHKKTHNYPRVLPPRRITY